MWYLVNSNSVLASYDESTSAICQQVEGGIPLRLNVTAAETSKPHVGAYAGFGSERTIRDQFSVLLIPSFLDCFVKIFSAYSAFFAAHVCERGLKPRDYILDSESRADTPEEKTLSLCASAVSSLWFRLCRAVLRLVDSDFLAESFEGLGVALSFAEFK